MKMQSAVPLVDALKVTGCVSRRRVNAAESQNLDHRVFRSPTRIDPTQRGQGVLA